MSNLESFARFSRRCAASSVFEQRAICPSFFFRGRFNGSLERSALHDDDGDGDDGGGSVWLFKHFHHKFVREGTRVSLAPCDASPHRSTKLLFHLFLPLSTCAGIVPVLARLVIHAAKTSGGEADGAIQGDGSSGSPGDYGKNELFTCNDGRYGVIQWRLTSLKSRYARLGLGLLEREPIIERGWFYT